MEGFSVSGIITPQDSCESEANTSDSQQIFKSKLMSKYKPKREIVI